MKSTTERLKNIRKYFEENFHEEFNETTAWNRRYVTFSSKNYNFIIHASFIQDRIDDDKHVEMKDRIDSVIEKSQIKKHHEYEFATKFSSGPIPIEYCVQEVIKS